MTDMESSPRRAGRIQDSVALVSGGGSGIGRETALLFAREGAKVAIGDIDPSKAHEAAEALRGLGAEALALPLDVTSQETWEATVHDVLEAWQRLDILVNCAGISDDAPITELSMKQWRRVMATNLDGTFLGTAAALKAMESSGRGAIVNVSSVSGIKASAGASAYCASKAAVLQLTRVAAMECAESGSRVRVNCVVPGGVKTPMWEKNPMWPSISATPEWNASNDVHPLKRFATPLEVARAILFLASEEASYITGTALVVDGGATA